MAISGFGSHQAYVDGDDLVIDWYDFGDDVPYESGNKLLFDIAGCEAICSGLDLDPPLRGEELAEHLANRFDSYLEIRTFVDSLGIPYRRETNFWP